MQQLDDCPVAHCALARLVLAFQDFSDNNAAHATLGCILHYEIGRHPVENETAQPLAFKIQAR